MLSRILTLLSVLNIISGEIDIPGVELSLNDGTKSLGYNVVYGDEDLTILNEVVHDYEKGNPLKKNKLGLSENLKPLPYEDVKCLMSVDRYCSKEMGALKSILIQALKDDCKSCTSKQKDDAGKVVASMMAYDPVAWKMFLTRYDGHHKVQKILG